MSDEFPFNLLVLEDDASMRETLQEVLSDEGYLVTAVGSAEEAVSLATQQAFDMIICDIRMKGMDGLDALALARKQQPNLTSMVVSGWTSEAETLRAIELNVGAFFRKPFSLDDFLPKVRQLLEKRREELRRQAEIEFLEKGLLWSLEAVCWMADEYSPEGVSRGALERSGKMALGMAQAFQLPARICQNIRLAAMLKSLQTLPRVALPEFSAQEQRLLGPLRALLSSEDPASFAARLVALAQFAGSPDSPPSLEEAAQRLSFPVDSRVGAVYEQVRKQQEESGGSLHAPEILGGLQDPHKVQASLLALARSLAQANDVESATKAYHKCHQQNPHSPDAVRALLGLGYLALAQGQDAQAWLIQACATAQSAGPVLGAHTRLEAGLMLVDSLPASALRLLREGRAELQELGMAGELGQVGAALWHLGELTAPPEHELLLLLQAGSRNEVSASSSWLLPRLLIWGAPQKELIAKLKRLVLDLAPTLEQQLSCGALSAPAREALLSILEQSASSPPGLTARLLEDPDSQIRSRAAVLGRSGQPEAPMLTFLSMGFFACQVGQSRVPEAKYKSQKVKYLLACLGASHKPLTEDYLLETFWPESSGPKRCLDSATSLLRSAFRQPGQPNDWNYILRQSGSLFLNPECARWHDADELVRNYEQGAEAFKQGDLEGERRYFRRAAEFYQGGYLDGYYAEWAVRRRSQLEEMVLHCWVRLAQQACDLRHYDEASEYSTRALEVDGSRQEAHVAKMRSFLGLNQPEKGVRHFEVSQRLLKNEYDTEPTMDFLEMYTRARHGLGDRNA